MLLSEFIRKMGYIILSPDVGDLACGTWGAGRLPPVASIAHATETLLIRKKQLKGKRILVTSGGTQEAIDAVRVISNRSSGKMGAALADACWQRGAEVTLLCPNTAVQFLRAPWRIKTQDTSDGVPKGLLRGGEIKVEIFATSSELEQLMKTHTSECDVIIHNAAVSDFIPTPT